MTTNTTFQPTLMQKLLGRNYKWWYVILFEVKSRTNSLFNNIFFIFGHMLILTGTMTTWWLANDKIIDDQLSQRWVYFLVGEIFLATIYSFTVFSGFDYIAGRHIPDLLKPQKYLKLKFFTDYGESLLQNFTKIFILILLVFVFVSFNWINVNPLNFFKILIFIPSSLLIFFFSNLMVGISGFFLKRMDGIALNYEFLASLLMGRIFPLNLVIENFTILIFNPFAYLFYHPMQVYLGKYDTAQTIWVFLGGLAWCVIFYFLTKLVFKLGLKRNESVGL